MSRRFKILLLIGLLLTVGNVFSHYAPSLRRGYVIFKAEGASAAWRFVQDARGGRVADEERYLQAQGLWETRQCPALANLYKDGSSNASGSQWTAQGQLLMARCALFRGDWSAARVLFERATTGFTGLDMVEQALEARLGILWADVRAGRDEDAARRLANLADAKLYEELATTWWLLQAEWRFLNGDYSGAFQDSMTALQLAGPESKKRAGILPDYAYYALFSGRESLGIESVRELRFLAVEYQDMALYHHSLICEFIYNQGYGLGDPEGLRELETWAREREDAQMIKKIALLASLSPSGRSFGP